MATIRQCDKCQSKVDGKFILTLDDLNIKEIYDLCEKCYNHVHKWLGTKEKKTFLSKVIQASKGVTGS